MSSALGQAQLQNCSTAGVGDAIRELPYVYGKPALAGTIRTRNEDFVVTEQLGFQASGSGEHLWHWVEKQGLTSLQVRDELARLYCCAAREIGMAGLKDKWACTCQWYSVPVAQAHPGAQAGTEFELQQGSWRVLALQRHQKKLQRGAHSGNHFKLRVADVFDAGQSEHAWVQFQQRVEQVKLQGFANYFGAQRFGYQGLNVIKAERAFRCRKRLSRDKKSLYISALRSFLYNELLGLRVADANWSTYCDGDVLMLNGSNSFFTPDTDLSGNALYDITRRLDLQDIHIGGLLFGGKFNACNDRAAAGYEAKVANQYSALLECLAMVAAQPGRRPMRAMPQGLQARADGHDVVLEFSLPAGCYATVLLRELLHINDAQQPDSAVNP